MGVPINLVEFKDSAKRIQRHILKTPVIELKAGISAKAENRQNTGSFKLRGALNRVLSIKPGENPTVVCASAGNHGLGVARACALVGFPCTVVVPATAATVKVEAIVAEGAKVRFAQGDYGAAEEQGKALAMAQGSHWISPYNDKLVILGQGTIGLEISDQFALSANRPFDVFVPASGGGLLCGVGLALKLQGSACRVIGVQTKSAPYLYSYFHKGTWDEVEEVPTLADGLAGPVDGSSITLGLLHRACDDFQLVTEDQIKVAMRQLMKLGEVVEASAAVAYAAALADNGNPNKIVVLTGGNIDKATLNMVANGEGR